MRHIDMIVLIAFWMPRNPWTAEEDEALRQGVRRLGEGEWRKILLLDVRQKLQQRSNVDLKDRWRILKRGGGVFPLSPLSVCIHSHEFQTVGLAPAMSNTVRTRALVLACTHAHTHTHTHTHTRTHTHTHTQSEATRTLDSWFR